MPKKQFKITDFTGGLNCFSDARDIGDNQFAQNWNASFDKYGVIRYTGAGEKHITNNPHSNTNFIPGGGLFSYSTDYSNNILDGSFDVPFEEGTVGAYTDTQTTITLAQTPSYNTQANHDSNDSYNNMTIVIYDGRGEGQSRQISDYVGSTNVATIDSELGLSDKTGPIINI